MKKNTVGLAPVAPAATATYFAENALSSTRFNDCNDFYFMTKRHHRFTTMATVVQGGSNPTTTATDCSTTTHSLGRPTTVVDADWAATVAVVQSALEDVPRNDIMGKHMFLGCSQYFSPPPSASEADEHVSSRVEEEEEGAGSQHSSSGDHHHHHHHQNMTRITVCSLGADLRSYYVAQDVVDEVLNAEHGMSAMEHCLLTAGAASLVHGEVDALGTGGWSHACFHDTTFSLFDIDGGLAHITPDETGRPVLRLWKSRDTLTDIPMAHIETVLVRLNDDNSEVSVSVGARGNQEHIVARAALEGSEENQHEELLALMVETEWMVKAAGHLAVALRRLGAAPGLRLPALLTADGNHFVAERNRRWRDMAKGFSRS